MTYSRSISDVDVMKELRNAIYGLRNCILVAGAGLSAQAVTKDGKHPPLWSGLLNGMIEWCTRNRLMEANDAKDLEALIKHGYLIEAGQEVEDVLREKSWQQQCVREVLLCNDAAFSLAHEHITRIPFRAYLTTNYDMLIEAAFSKTTRRPLARFYERSIDSILEEYREGRTFILKLHGDVDDASSIILGDRAYERLLNSHTNYRGCLQTLFSMSSILFVGFGGADPDLDGLLSKVAAFDGRRGRHWMVVPGGQFPSLKAKRLLRDRGVAIVEYERDDTHSGLVTFLEALARPPLLVSAEDGSGAGDRPPHERALPGLSEMES